MNKHKMICHNCGGVGEVYWTDIVGYITHDMAMDACDMNYEGQPMYGEVHSECPVCNGTGHVYEDGDMNEK
jgi:DnaJ-class molecular chaperone